MGAVGRAGKIRGLGKVLFSFFARLSGRFSSFFSSFFSGRFSLTPVLSPRRVARRIWQARRRVLLAILLLIAAPFVLVGVMALFTSLPSELREPAAPSLRVVASNGQLLREVRTDDGARSRPLPLSSFPMHTRNAVLAAEDRHFYSHVGVDVSAVCRALVSNIRHRRIVSGASTITMQLARTLRPRNKKRSVWGKLTEMALAVRIEASLSKDQILEEYLNRVIYGPNLRGYAAASQAYFGTPPESLSLAEAALIAGLPRGPSLYVVTKRPDLARRRRDRVLTRMAEAAMIDDGARDRAIAEPIVTSVDKPTFGAPHLVRGLVMGGALAKVQPLLAQELASSNPDRATLSEIQTTIDPEIQRAAESAVVSTLASLVDKHVAAASVVVIDNATGDVLAYVGSPDFFDAAALGQNDGVMALRQPGSSLKPFVYAEAMSSLGYTGATLLPDVEIHIPLPGGGDYVPHDYDAKVRGPVRLREALGNSLNIPAVYTIHQIGTQRVLDRLHAVGFDSLTEDAEHYGPALALGDGEVTLLELANAYATLAREGIAKPVRIVKRLVHADTNANANAKPNTDANANPNTNTSPNTNARWVDLVTPPSRRVLEARVARMLTDILMDKKARTAAFGDQNILDFEFDVAAKTGTSKGYRDNVAVGYTQSVTVAVWAGNFDGSPMAEVSGITGAGPIFHAVMEAAAASSTRSSSSSSSTHRHPRLVLDAEDAARVGLARTAVCSLSGEIPTSACPHRIYEWLPEGEADHAPSCTTHERVRIDVRNGLRAGEACSSEVTQERVFERWGSPYEGWARQTGRPLLGEGSSPECPIDEPTPIDVGHGGASDGAAGDPTAPRITYPFDGARFVIDPDRPSALQMLEIHVEPEGKTVEVRVDDVVLRANERSTRTWMLTPGAHTITARSGPHVSAPVHLTVR